MKVLFIQAGRNTSVPFVLRLCEIDDIGFQVFFFSYGSCDANIPVLATYLYERLVWMKNK